VHIYTHVNFLIARVQDFDVDGNGTVDLEEFKHMVKVWFFVYCS
jgi:Ca2+-binding EF-hand superfamily protein